MLMVFASRRSLTLLSVPLLAVGLVLTTYAGDYKPPDLPQVFHAKTYPIHESHDDERVAVALDPYFEPEKADVLHVPYRKHDLLPVRFIITNDGNNPVTLKGMKVEFITAHNEKQEPASTEDIQRRLANQPRTQTTTPPLPLPLPRKSRGRVTGSTQDEIDYLQFKARAVEAHSTQSGFFFFDTSGMSDPLAGSHIYITGIRNGDGQELFYFDLPLRKGPANQDMPLVP
jgi:hypothetical protein